MTTTSPTPSPFANARRSRSSGTACRPSTALLHRDTLIDYLRALPDHVAAHVWITDALGTEDLGLSRACDLLDPILPCFVRDPDARQQILDETRNRIMRFADTITDLT